MQKFLILMALALASAGVNAHATGISDAFDARIDSGLQMMNQGDYEEAVAIFSAFIGDHPENPAGYFFRAGVNQMRMTAMETEYWKEACNADLDSALALSNRAIAASKGDAWAFFFRGGTSGYQSARDAKAGGYLSAVSKGLSAASDLKKAVALDPALYDAYMGIGSFHYFRTRATSFLKWLPFVGDARQKGIDELGIAIAKGRYLRTTSENALLWIYIDYGKFNEALALAASQEEEFPRNAFFHWTRPEIYWRTRQWARALEAYRKLYDLIDANRPINNYNRVVVKYRMAKCLYELGRYREAAAAASEAVALPIDDASAKRLVNERRKAQAIAVSAAKKAGR